ncbi:Sir2 family NAD-dependent protein deacetylase [Cellulomonas sp. P24]|uniref:SIR2 family NAD-dependent protein deacylase n=1 Tax=Cellulomonas sp. P24 TaxID=2885206 RepID=UPI00216B65A8|nr:Sir2 family NAD-dependent protein deacetylase [Cellulomonas sp. P24]MCR6492553.1 Sir2 family NAD-dependent protein deacetylase [Cellulomonas sp. P24]
MEPAPSHDGHHPQVTVLAGAGMSTGSGIPDFRGPDGVWTRDPLAARLLDLDWYVTDPAIRRRTWQMWRESPVWTAEPTAAHRSLTQLAAADALRAVCTQNFDGLQQRAGTSPEAVLELHGSLTGTRCLDCDARQPTVDVLARLDTDPDPHCARCGGLLATDVVMFGEALPTGVLEAAVEAATSCEVFIAVGSTLKVQPAASLTAMAAEAGAHVVIVNADPTPYDRLADEVDRRPIDQALPELVERLLRA